VSIDVATCAYEIAPMIARSQAAFRRDLPDLLKTHYRQWVAYHGEDRIRFGRSLLGRDAGTPLFCHSANDLTSASFESV